ncbi:MAG: hypothetical protein NTV44_06000, partial [Firmicutes bacterium]|nr:hypothetical protein [Bacillota bacterium]
KEDIYTLTNSKLYNDTCQRARPFFGKLEIKESVTIMESLKELYKIGFGPSSSHTMGPARASEYFIALFPNAYRYEVVLFGSLSLTGRGHLTDAKIIEVFKDRKINVIFSHKFEGLTYSNTMDFFAYSETNQILGHK